MIFPQSAHQQLLFQAVASFKQTPWQMTASTHTAVKSVLKAVSSARCSITNPRLRTDNGTRYSSHRFKKAIQTLGIGREFIWKQTPEQNGRVESFHGTLKREYIWPHEFARFQDAKVVLAEAFEDYNKNRIHSASGYLTPDEFARTMEVDNK